MIKQYDEFSKLGQKDMSKRISEMTYLYVNPETNKPTVVPAKHYDKILGQIKEELILPMTLRNFLITMYTQLKALYDEEPKLFQEALLCLELGLKPKDLKISEQIALQMTSKMLEENRKGKEFHLLDSSIIDFFDEIKDNPDVHAQILRESNSTKRDVDFER